MSRGVTETRVSGLLPRFSGCSDTTAGVNGRECLLQIRIFLGTPRSALQGLTSWSSTRPPRRFSVWRLRACCHLGVPHVGLR